ncbi:hypothetical protein CQW23_35395 [Capsicum baccatum]|uniref:Uncharacterized protein n=1 Tax=Capsicum baccatum TaxID=33114 RepID=A0A2G2UW25_CAPBA|nr:hypothetical protein CQW23_35395 [Capsicum baccatum]
MSASYEPGLPAGARTDSRYAAQETDFEQSYIALAPRLRWQAGQDVAARAGIQPNLTCQTQLTRRASKCSVDARPAIDAERRIPLVRTSSELAIRRAGKAPEGTVPSPSPVRHAVTRSRREISSSSPPTADGFETGTPVPSPQSQSFSQTYGSILPTSLAYIVPSTRGCSPWRPNAVMSTTGC